jgi:hypothetical protein
MSEIKKFGELDPELVQKMYDSGVLAMTQLQSALQYIIESESIENIKYIATVLRDACSKEFLDNSYIQGQDGKFIAVGNLKPLLICLLNYLEKTGGNNYLELSFQPTDEEIATEGNIVVTIQRAKGLTPTQKLALAELRIQEMSQEIEDLKQDMRDLADLSESKVLN